MREKDYEVHARHMVIGWWRVAETRWARTVFRLVKNNIQFMGDMFARWRWIERSLQQLYTQYTFTDNKRYDSRHWVFDWTQTIYATACLDSSKLHIDRWQTNLQFRRVRASSQDTLNNNINHGCTIFVYSTGPLSTKRKSSELPRLRNPSKHFFFLSLLSRYHRMQNCSSKC